jgi:hypothetical protein
MNAAERPLQPNHAMLLDHLSFMFGDALDGRFEITGCDPATGKPSPRFTRTFDLGDIDEAASYAAEINSAPGCNVYFTPALLSDSTPASLYRSSAKDVTATFYVWADLDDAGAAERAAKIAGTTALPSAVVTTGRHPHTRQQLYFLLDEPLTDHDTIRALNSAACITFGGDPSVVNPARIMRLGGTVAWPTKDGRIAEMTQFVARSKEPYSIDRLSQVLRAETRSPMEQPADTLRAASTDLSGLVVPGHRDAYMRDTVLACFRESVGETGCAPTADELFEMAWPQFERGTGLPSSAFETGKMRTKIRYTLHRFGQGKLPGLPTLDAVVASHRDRKTTGMTLQGPAESISGASITAIPFAWTDPETLPLRPWLLGHFLIRGCVSVTIAPGGVGKSSMALAEAVSLSTGRPLLHDVPRQRCRTWYVNLEDPRDEQQRRVMGVAKHHHVSRHELDGWLYLNSSQDTEMTIASQDHGGVRIAVPVVDAVIKEIRDKGIDAMTVDPFVSSHQVSENDNGAIDRVTKTWASIAAQTGCAIHLVHHARKTTGGKAVEIDDARGASALISAARAARTLNTMSAQEAEKYAIEDRFSYVRVDDGKANLAPRSELARWHRIVSVCLGNGALGGSGDFVGVFTKWKAPDLAAGFTTSDLIAAQEAVAAGEWRSNIQAGDWVGRPIAGVLGLNVDDKADRARVVAILRQWIDAGYFAVVMRKDTSRRERPYIEVGKLASDEPAPPPDE